MIMHTFLNSIIFLCALFLSLSLWGFHIPQINTSGDSHLVAAKTHILLARKSQAINTRNFISNMLAIAILTLTFWRSRSHIENTNTLHVRGSFEPEITGSLSKLLIEEMIPRNGPYSITTTTIVEKPLEPTISSLSPSNTALDEGVVTCSSKIFTASSHSKELEPFVEKFLGLTYVDKLFNPSVTNTTLEIFPVRISGQNTSERAGNELYESQERVRMFLSDPERPWTETVESEITQTASGVGQSESEPQPEVQETRVDRMSKILKDFEKEFPKEETNDAAS